MVKNVNGCKTLEICWWLQLSKRQILTFLPRLSFDNAQALAFTLAYSTSAASGVLITRYVRSGEVRTGAFEEVE
jgi:hypothetical protein